MHEAEMAEDVLPVKAKREGEVPGIHVITYKPGVDEIEIRLPLFPGKVLPKGRCLRLNS